MDKLMQNQSPANGPGKKQPEKREEETSGTSGTPDVGLNEEAENQIVNDEEQNMPVNPTEQGVNTSSDVTNSGDTTSRVAGTDMGVMQQGIDERFGDMEQRNPVNH